MLRLLFLLTVAALTLSAGAVPATHALTRSTTDRPDDRPGKQVHIVYAVPSDGVDHALDTNGTLVDSVAVWEQWFVSQTGDSQLRLDTYRGDADVTFLRLPFTAQQIAAAAPEELAKFQSALAGAGLSSPSKEYGVYYDGASTVVPGCGRGGSLLGVVYLQRNSTLDCAPVPFHHPGEQPEYREFIMVHELLHGLGMVPTCAPHWSFDNHVTETKDVMTGGIIGNDQQLDVGRDDYFRAHIPGCLDLADSPYMAPPPPGVAGNVTATAGSDQATVAFTPASGAVTAYTVTATPGGATATGTAGPLTVTGLLHGISYTFVVTAANGAEPGAASAPSNAVTPYWGPTAPLGVVATAGDRQATVSFGPPTLSGDSPIDHYTVVASPGGASASGSTSPIVVTGLTNGVAYTFTVAATNTSAWPGPASAPSSPVTPVSHGRSEIDPPAEAPRPAVPDAVVPAHRPPRLH